MALNGNTANTKDLVDRKEPPVTHKLFFCSSIKFLVNGCRKSDFLFNQNISNRKAYNFNINVVSSKIRRDFENATAPPILRIHKLNHSSYFPRPDAILPRYHFTSI